MSNNPGVFKKIRRVLLVSLLAMAILSFWPAIFFTGGWELVVKVLLLCALLMAWWILHAPLEATEDSCSSC
jgi:Ca2+/Na+ antiporter